MECFRYRLAQELCIKSKTIAEGNDVFAENEFLCWSQNASGN